MENKTLLYSGVKGSEGGRGGGVSRLLLFWSKSRIKRLPFLNASSRCCLKDFTARRRKNKFREQKGRRGEGQRGTCSGLEPKPLKLHPFSSDFTSLGFFLSPFTPYSLSYSPTLCSLAPHFLSTLFISLPSNPSLHTRSLSIHLVEQCFNNYSCAFLAMTKKKR